MESPGRNATSLPPDSSEQPLLPQSPVELPQSLLLLVPTRWLLLLAALTWLAAGAGVTAVGVKASTSAWTWSMAAGFGLTFAAFFALFFHLAERNAQRILNNRQLYSFILGFFDANSYIIMAVMVFLGASVRISTLVPDPAIASFYSGLGLALIFASLHLVIRYVQAWEGPRFLQ